MAAAIKAGFYTVGIGAGVETMSQNPMAWEGGVNPRVAESKNAQNCLVPMGAHAAQHRCQHGASFRFVSWCGRHSCTCAAGSRRCCRLASSPSLTVCPC